MKVMILGHLGGASNGKFGGAEKSMVKLANWLSTRCETVLVSVDGPCDSFDILPSVVCDFRSSDKTNKFTNNVCLRRNSLDAVKKHRPDVVIGFWIQSTFYVSSYCGRHGIRLFYAERNDPRLQYGRALRLMRGILVSRCTGVVFQTNEAMSFFPLSVQRKSVVIHNPVYSSPPEVPKTPDGRIVAVGRLSPQKNHRLLIEAFSRISSEFDSLSLEIYGEGPLKEDLLSFAASLGLEGRVLLPGTFKEILDKISGAALFVLPSNYEGMPNTLLEAMSLGLPCVSTDCPCGGPREIIQNGVNGLLVPVGDVEALVDAMRRILIDLPFADSMRREAVKICDTHNEDKIFQMWYDFIRNRV